MPPRRALVTGGSRGIGRAIVLGLASTGYHVAAAARTTSALEETAAMARGAAGRVVALTADIGDRLTCEQLPQRAATALGGHVEILVHSAGIVRPARLSDITVEDWETVMAVNVTAAFLLAKAAAPAMAEAGWGRIVNIGSLYSRVGGPHAGAYVSSKHAILGLTRTLAIELVKRGVTANTVIPGWTDTDITRDEAESVAKARGISAEEAIKIFLRNQPLGRMIRPDEVAAVVTFLCSDAAAAITAQAINVDGGSLQS